MECLISAGEELLHQVVEVAYIGVFSIFEWEIERLIQVAPVERWKLYHLLW